MKYNVLILGSGGREHAIVWALYNDRKINKIYCAPGNAGTSEFAENVTIDILNNKEILDFVYNNKIDITIVTVAISVPVRKFIFMDPPCHNLQCVR